jgi:hypothetical protein
VENFWKFKQDKSIKRSIMYTEHSEEKLKKKGGGETELCFIITLKQKQQQKQTQTNTHKQTANKTNGRDLISNQANRTSRDAVFWLYPHAIHVSGLAPMQHSASMDDMELPDDGVGLSVLRWPM